MSKTHLKNEITVLITGAGSPSAVTIFKAMRSSSLNPRIIAMDADPLSVGLFRADVAYCVPKVIENKSNYIEKLITICRQEKVQIVCFGTEVEMQSLAPLRAEIEKESGARLILNEALYLDLFMDKWRTAELLREYSIPAPDSVMVSDRHAVEDLLKRHSYPLLLKPRKGSGSKNCFVIHNQEELDFFGKYVPDAVLQEYLFPDNEEYTIGVYKSLRQGYVGQIIFKRNLASGLTYKAELVHDPEIESVCRKLVETFDIWGPINIQLRKTPSGPKIFEVNLRFSSSCSMRAHLGFNEAEMCIRDLILGESIPAPAIESGFELRYWDEVHVSKSDYEKLVSAGTSQGRCGFKMEDF